jgi:primosomal protein N' (replication factor Y) (superfamily II helicase)
VTGLPRVLVAVDAPRVPGGQSFTYHVPARLAGLLPGEVVLVEYGRRQTIGVVMSLSEAAGDDGRATKPILARVRSDGPVLADLSLRLAAHVSSHYQAPPGLVLRAMLPPGLLEQVQMMVRAVERSDDRRPAFGTAPAAHVRRAGAAEAVDAALLAEVRDAGSEGRMVADVAVPMGRGTLLRRLHALEAAGLVELAWQVRPPAARPRRERTAALSQAGRAAGESFLTEEGSNAPGPGARGLGPRQRALLCSLVGDPADAEPVAAADLARRFGASAVSGLARRGLLELGAREVPRRPLDGRGVAGRGALPADADLTPDQDESVARIVTLVEQRRAAGLLVDGVTASGKTAVYAAAIRACLAVERPALVLVPEIAMAMPLIDRLRHDLATEIAMLHSGLGAGERADEWRQIRSGAARVVVGTRMAVLAPLADVGLVIVDDEHDAAYKSDRTPRYQARDVALQLGRLAGAPVVLGSATPDVVSVGRVRLGQLEHLRLPDRARGRRPAVEVVDLREELAEGNRGLLSARLMAELRGLDREAGDRAVLVINRRGSASVVLCRDCGYVQVCPECERPLVFHAASMALRCHHCGASAPPARRCPACGSPRIRYLGGGTQRVEHELRVRLPELRVGRLDRDVVALRGAAVRVVDAFADGSLDVLVGTGLVAKGLDVPEVTLVGVVSADVALHLPDERAVERTWQLLEQAIGRAGRGERPGRAIIQTYSPEHPAVTAVASGDWRPFVDAELELRKRFGSPPFGSLIKLTAGLEDRDAAERAAHDLATELRARAVRSGAQVAVLGPVPAYVARRAGRWRFHVVLRGEDPLGLLGADPGPPWSIDVDPESLL